MSALICVCQTIGTPETVRQCEYCFKYYFGDRRLTSVGRVIDALLPFDASGIDPDVLENAKARGSIVDTYLSEYIEGSDLYPISELAPMIQERFVNDKHATADEHAIKCVNRIEMLMDWWKASGLKAKPQHIFYSVEDGIAGKCDLVTEDMVIDLKCVAKLQPSYALQLGAYLCMDSQKFPLRDAAILHVTKEKVRLVKYDTKKIKAHWKAAVAWWQASKELK